MKKAKINKKFKKLVRDAASDYQNILGFWHYDVKILYFDEDWKKDGDNLEDRTLAQCSVDKRYLTGTLKIYPCFEKAWKTKEFDNEEVRKVVAHEMAHLATQFMFDLAIATYRDEGEMLDAWESLTTTVGRLLYEVKKHKK